MFFFDFREELNTARRQRVHRRERFEP